ncbi:hypothetical protein RHGRI_029543 [Rhododendron griersonianum]|uniref:Cation-transporting P-type ATPase C-terminal domain-containing protein n=1 Tax=Rhododendron griersonianum TaxID=479676 RepID=A0AAV6IM28_9ERIC|nr:hypothetical protein RHGRI_029451 [Rhododendron griersonianum]KAG5528920.1 hypothetical protein RHGRI_029543 [Rhododendron griersonianum]
MANLPQGLPIEFWERDAERVEFRLFIQTLWMQLFIFILLCALLTMRIPPWFGWNVNVDTLWYWIGIIAAVVAAIIREYENQGRQALNIRR